MFILVEAIVCPGFLWMIVLLKVIKFALSIRTVLGNIYSNRFQIKRILPFHTLDL